MDEVHSGASTTTINRTRVNRSQFGLLLQIALRVGVVAAALVILGASVISSFGKHSLLDI